jgi:hypothetical protein
LKEAEKKLLLLEGKKPADAKLQQLKDELATLSTECETAQGALLDSWPAFGHHKLALETEGMCYHISTVLPKSIAVKKTHIPRFVSPTLWEYIQGCAAFSAVVRINRLLHVPVFDSRLAFQKSLTVDLVDDLDTTSASFEDPKAGGSRKRKRGEEKKQDADEDEGCLSPFAPLPDMVIADGDEDDNPKAGKEPKSKKARFAAGSGSGSGAKPKSKRGARRGKG